MNGVSPALGGAVWGFQAMTKGALAFIATPIGAVIAAIGLAIGALTSYFKDNEEGQNKLTAITNTLSAVWGVFTDKISAFGKIVLNAIEDPKQAFVDLGDAIVQNLINRWEGFVNLISSGGSIVVEGFKALAAKVKIALADVPIIGKAIDLDQATKDYEDATAKMVQSTKDFAKNVIVATTGLKDPLQTVSNLYDEINKNIEVGNELTTKQVAIRKQEQTIASETAKLQVQIAELRLKAKKEDEFSASERITFLKEAQRLTDEQFKKEEDLARLRYESKVQENALANSTVEDKVEEDKLLAELTLKEQSRLNANRKLETEIQTNKKKFQTEEQVARDQEVQAEINKANEIKKIKDNELAQSKKRANDEKKIRKAIANAAISLASNIFQTTSKFLKEGSTASKIFAVADATVNTYKGVTNALANVPAPFNIPAAIATGAQGFAAVQSINSTSPSSSNGGSGGGGSSLINGSTPQANPQIDTNPIDQQLAQQEALIAATGNIGMSVSVTEINNVQNDVQLSEQTATI